MRHDNDGSSQLKGKVARTCCVVETEVSNVRFDQLNWLPLHQIWWLRASGLYCKIGHLSRGGMADKFQRNRQLENTALVAVTGSESDFLGENERAVNIVQTYGPVLLF